jgi:hypothetical protein
MFYTSQNYTLAFLLEEPLHYIAGKSVYKELNKRYRVWYKNGKVVVSIWKGTCRCLWKGLKKENLKRVNFQKNCLHGIAPFSES